MKIRRKLFLCIVLAWQVANTDGALSPDALALADWIAARQFHNPTLPSYGAIASAEGPAAIGVDGRQYFSVSPYSANLAVLCLLKSRAPNALNVAEAWIAWYFDHLNRKSAPDGVPFNHFYRANGEGETTCVKSGDPSLCHYNDATDSAAATFFLVLEAAHEAGMPASKLNTPQRKEHAEDLASLVLNLQQPDGLCWAKADYHVKYLEDNSEVFAGLGALANLEKDVFGAAQRSALYQNAAERIRRGTLTDLYDPKARLFFVAKFENNARPAPNLGTWYPDTQCQLWPVLFGVVTAHDPRAQAAAAAVDDHWNGRIRPDWARDPQHVNQGWVEAGHAYAALLMGETNCVATYSQAVKHYKFRSEAGRVRVQFAGPFSVDDAGWLLRILTATSASANSSEN